MALPYTSTPQSYIHESSCTFASFRVGSARASYDGRTVNEHNFKLADIAGMSPKVGQVHLAANQGDLEIQRPRQVPYADMISTPSRLNKPDKAPVSTRIQKFPLQHTKATMVHIKRT